MPALETGGRGHKNASPGDRREGTPAPRAPQPGNLGTFTTCERCLCCAALQEGSIIFLKAR